MLIAPLPVILDAVEAVKTAAESKQQKIAVNIPDALPDLMLDEDMIRRVIINLLENAVKYTPAGSIIKVEAQEKEDEALIWVDDNGPGIPPDEHIRIFNKFTRLKSREGSKGLGLGLAYCRLAVEAHGGRIWVESEPGKGARFIFTVPIPVSET